MDNRTPEVKSLDRIASAIYLLIFAVLILCAINMAQCGFICKNQLDMNKNASRIENTLSDIKYRCPQN